MLGSPKAWLGTAYHEVLAAAAGGGSGASAAEVWEQATRAQHVRARAHPLDHRFGAPDRWPGYHLTRAMALMRAQRVVGEGDSQVVGPGSSPNRDGVPSNNYEQWLTAAGGRLVGRPDLLRNDTVIDYKTGTVFEHGEGDVVKASYIRQLQLYAFLVKESTGCWPTRGVLLPMEGLPIEVDLCPSDCERIAAESLELLDQYNGAVLDAAVAELAKPSVETCQWCPFKLVCPAFWERADSSWSEHLGTSAVGGPASSAPVPIHGGSALALRLNVEEGTEPIDTVNVAPLQRATHPVLSQVQSGTRIRIVDLARRADGSVTPTRRTVVARTVDLPEIVVAANRTEARGNIGMDRAGISSQN